LKALRAAALALAAVAAATGCGGGGGDGDGGPSDNPTASTTPKVIDTREVENTLVATQKRATPELDVRDPSCPARVEVSEGVTFPCTIAVEGVIVPYQVTLADVATRVRYNIRPAKAILLLSKLADALTAQVPTANVDCGPERIKVLDVGATLDCRLSDRAQSRTITFRVDDVDGNVSPVNP